MSFDVNCEFYEMEDTIPKTLTIKSDSWQKVFLRIKSGDKCASIKVNGDELILAIKHCMANKVE